MIYKNNNIGAENKINFFISVENEWQLPNNCKYCFPPINQISLEEPLIQANRSSVVPMTMYGIEENFGMISNLASYEEDEKRLLPLKDALCYGHIIRSKKNHFKYYFKTDKVMETILTEQNKAFDEWLKNEIEKLCEYSNKDQIVFNFIVAPLHKTNAQFVYKINSTINAKQIIWLDTAREYRDNVKAKYSNLTTLVKNLINENKNEKIHIHFHFVDDTITSGFTINRSKDLLNSLFYDFEEHSNVEIRLFSSVILLLNRCSNNTKLNYVEKGRFKSYLDLNISVMRSHSDACVPCKKYDEYSEILSKGAATNMLSSITYERAKSFEFIDESDVEAKVSTADHSIACCINETQNREECFAQLVASHRFNILFNSLGGNKNNKKNIEFAILKELNSLCNDLEKDENRFEWSYHKIIAAIDVLSRPFFIYRHSILKAITKILLDILELIFLGTSKKNVFLSKENESLKYFLLKVMQRKDEKSKDFILHMLVWLSDINSTALIRPRTMVAFWKTFEENEFEIEELCSEYVLCVKKLLDLSGRENLSSWLEKMLSDFSEPYPKSRNKYKDLLSLKGNHFFEILKLENTLPIRNALEECNKAYLQNNKESTKNDINTEQKMLKIVNDTLQQYYCKSYCDLMKADIEKMNYNKYCQETFLPIFKLYEYLISNEKVSNVPYYHEFLKLVKDVLKINNAVILIQTDFNVETHGVNRLYPDKFSPENKSVNNMIEFEVEKRIYENKIEWIGDTYATIERDNLSIGVIKLGHNFSKENNNKTPVWYIAFTVESDSDTIKEDMIIRVRNLLSMRWIMAKRLNDDFNNNIIGEFINYKDKFEKLGTDKSGSHTPYSELSEAFYDIRDKINECQDDANKRIFANQYKLIADSIISKWYIHSVLKTFPNNMNPKEVPFDVPKKLSRYMDVLLITRCANADNGGANVRCSSDSVWKISWDEVTFTAPFRCDYMWCAAFQSLIFNALHHGYNIPSIETETENIVDISISYEDGSLIITNRMKNGDRIATDSITLTALKYFFDIYYGKDSFKAQERLGENGELLFEAIIPCVRKDEEPNENMHN